MRDAKCRQSELVILAITALVLSLATGLGGCSGCRENKCKTNEDCQSGKICENRKCITSQLDSGIWTDSSGDTDTDTDTDAEVDSNPDADSETTADAGPDGDAGLDGGIDTENCRATQQFGETCAHHCQCIFGHCDNHLCCLEGECCISASDCEDDLCVVPSCDGNNSCRYGVGDLTCGEQDLAGAKRCDGAMVCNGTGQCLPLTKASCGYYQIEGYTCGATYAVERCYADCTAENAPVSCIEGARCTTGQCAASLGLANGEPCAMDGECASSHCGSGFCCPVGECCGLATDCQESLCRNRVCTGDHRCVYNFTGYSCGMEDIGDGEICTGETRCDGTGSCVVLGECSGAYTWNPTANPPYTCDEEQVVTACYESCINASYCAPYHACLGEACTFVGLADGERCENHTECGSGHCSNGFCCEEGDCCAGDADCTDSLCNTASVCGADYICTPDDPMSCGFEDTQGDETCTGDHHCDGRGNCVTVDRCDAAYAWDGTYTCAEGSVAEDCWSGCYGAFDDPRCNEAYACDDGTCIPIGLLPNGASCSSNEACESGHCEGAICCTGEECCRDAADCDRTECVLRYCDGSFNCDYRPISPCGTADRIDEPGDGSGLCEGDSRCDGIGSCAVVERCDLGYAATGVYACADGSVAEVCETSCTTSAQCNDDSYCSNGACIPKIPNGGSGCARNSDCFSHYCTSSTGVCCDGGWCCDDDADCAGFPCNETDFTCDFSCDNGGDADSMCAPLGDFHCDDGACFEDLPDGEGICNEPSDCLSGYCDPETRICCPGGSCCASDGDCGGGHCDVSGQCAGVCGESDSMCGDAYHCDTGLCVADLPNGDGVCDEDSDCASGNCTEATGICCSLGEGICCNDVSDCDDDNPCTLDGCSALYHCYALDKAEGERCDDGIFCNGTERCDAEGACVAAESPCQPSDSICAVEICNETDDICERQVVPENVGAACSAPLFCLNNRQKVCTDTGLCQDPNPAGGMACEGETGDPCTSYLCDEENNLCVESQLSDGTGCDDSDPCNGSDQCWGGTCVRGPTLPCDDGDPCTADPCTDNGGTPVCGDHTTIADGQPCNDYFACYGASPVCANGICVPSEDPCADVLGICTIRECSEHYYGETECSQAIPNTGYPVNCGETVSFDETTSYIFATIEYDDYGDLCPGYYPGMEAAISVYVENPGSVTVSVSGTSPPTDVQIMDLTDWCQADTCERSGRNSLTIDAVGYHVLVLEPASVLPPTELEVSVSDCP